MVLVPWAGVLCIKMWLLGLELWHLINSTPWHGTAHLKRATQGSKVLTPSTSLCPLCPLITMRHLLSLRHHLTLTDTIDAAVFTTATVAFWCQCRPAEVTVANNFDPTIHASHASPQKLGITSSNMKFHSFWVPQTKTHHKGEEICWTDSGCTCSAEFAFQNHCFINSHFCL